MKLLTHLAVWAGLLFAFWIALTDNTRPWELLAGGVCAVLAGAGAMGVARLGRVTFRPQARWARNVPAVLWSVVRDNVIVLAAALRPTAPHGRMRALPFDARDESRMAVAATLGSAGPNQYVVAESAQDGVLVVHELVPAGSVGPAEAVR